MSHLPTTSSRTDNTDVYTNETSRTSNPTLMSDSCNTSSDQRTWGVQEIVEHIRRLAEKDAHDGLEMLKRAIAKGKLLQSLKEQTNHGDWTSYLKKLGIHERYAQRLMSLPMWHVQLMAQNRKCAPQTISVTQACRLVSQWNQLSSGKEKVKRHQKQGAAFQLKDDGTHIFFGMKVKRAELAKIVSKLEAEDHTFIKQILQGLKSLT